MPAERQAAREGTQSRGGRIVGTLGFLAALTALSTAIGVWFSIKGTELLQGFLKDVGQLPSTDAAFRDLVLPNWFAPSLAVLNLLGGVLLAYALWISGRFIAAVRDYTLQPDSRSAEELETTAHTIRPWLTLGQWAPLLNIVLSLGLLAALFQMFGTESTGFSMNSPEALSIVLTTVAQSLPSFIINWLILGAVKRWLDGVVTRTTQPNFALRPLARAVDPWFILTMILLILGAVGLLLGGLPMLALPSMLSDETLTDPGLVQSGITPEWLRMALYGMALFTIIIGLFYVLLTCLIAWSRGFAMNVATVLDPAPAAPQAATPDLWSGSEQLIEPRQPR